MLGKKIAAAVSAAVLTLGAVTALSGSAEETKKLRVMPLGDSITDGFTVTGGYRIPLWYMLQEEGIVDGIDFVGPNGWYIDGVCDPDHAGYSGYTIADCPGRSGIYNFIDWLMTEYPADVVMLQIGTNDILSGYELDAAGDRLELLVDSILTYIPEDGMLFVSTIPYMDADVTTYTDAYTAAEMDAAVDDYNAKVRAVVQKKIAEGKPVTQADVNSVLTKADLSDGVHPSEDGYRKMAEYWCGVLTDFCKGEPQSPTQPPTETASETALDTDKLSEGDVNGDGVTDLLDVIALQKYLLCMGRLEKPEKADPDGDGVIDVYDLAKLKWLLFHTAA